MATVPAWRETADGAWLGRGALGGLLGGAALMAFEIVLAAVTMGASWALLPVRFAAGVLLGAGAVDPASPPVPVAIAGALVHVTLSAGFGALFASIMEQRDPGRPRRTSRLVLPALAYGAGLWLVNFYVIAPYAGWAWFPRRTDPGVQLLGHALVFAPAVALYLARVESRVREVIVETTEPDALRRAA